MGSVEVPRPWWGVNDPAEMEPSWHRGNVVVPADTVSADPVLRRMPSRGEISKRT